MFGNASREIVDRTTTELAGRLSADLDRTFPVYNGSASPLESDAPSSALPPAHDALVAALEAGPLTIVALGPLTNVASVLSERPDLSSRIRRLVAVMGRRPGHIFHPAEGAEAGILFGHGPVFRDFNFVMDVRASMQVLAMNLPTTFVPYDAARGIEITAGDLDRLHGHGGAITWVAERARPWLRYWREDIGRRGFYPFDLLAAAYVTDPDRFECASVQAWVGEDATLFVPFWRPTALLVGDVHSHPEHAQAIGSAKYCAKVATDLKARVMHRFAS